MASLKLGREVLGELWGAITLKKGGDKPERRQRLPLWAILTIWLVMSVGFAVYSWILVRQDEAIAPGEQVARGSVYKVNHGKHDTALYTFSFAGETYYGSDSVRSDQCLCEVAVYFDPAHPTTNNLVEYRLKSLQDNGVMIGCSYAAIGLAALLTLVLAFKKARQKPEADYLDVSKSIT